MFTSSDGDENDREGLTRREWAKLAVAAGVAGAGALVGVEILAPLLAPTRPHATIREDLVYAKLPNPQWWDDRVGQSIRVDDFQVWQGAFGVWRGLFRDGAHIEGTGFPILVIRILRENTYFRPPDPATYGLPYGYDLYYDDPGKDVRIVVLFDRCTHMCCYPGWHSLTASPIPRNYDPPPPTWTAYGQDPIWCVCHDAQYDPLLLTADVNPVNGVRFVGARVVHGPATYSLAVVPVRAIAGVLFGGMPDPRWYAYC
jgi:Rieske Fe-S protein